MRAAHDPWRDLMWVIVEARRGGRTSFEGHRYRQAGLPGGAGQAGVRCRRARSTPKPTIRCRGSLSCCRPKQAGVPLPVTVRVYSMKRTAFTYFKRRSPVVTHREDGEVAS
jgi:hypothetical protein